MELSGLQIFKYLPGGKKTEQANCKKCSMPTCMAYALKLAKQQVELDDCPYVPEDLKALFQKFVKKQQNEFSIGSDNQIKVGGEIVMFRHEKTFVNKTVIALELDTEDKDFDNKIERIKKYKVERVGEEFKIKVLYLTGKNNLVNKAQQLSDYGFSLIIKTDDINVINELKTLNPIFDTDVEIDSKCNITVFGRELDEVKNNTSKLLAKNFENIVINLDIENQSIQKIIEKLTYIRRLGILNRNEFFAHPVMVKLQEDDEYKTLSLASLLLCRYANIIVLKSIDEALLTTLFTLRQNIYTDPQKPLQVEPKIYEFNEPNQDAVVLMTTNFALTYFAVANEIESTNIPAYLVVTASDGMSVLTAWSADKFTSELVAKTLRESNLVEKVKNRRIIIPGLLAHMKEELEEEIPNWDFIVGPVEAYQLPDFIKNNR